MTFCNAWFGLCGIYKKKKTIQDFRICKKLFPIDQRKRFLFTFVEGKLLVEFLTCLLQVRLRSRKNEIRSFIVHLLSFVFVLFAVPNIFSECAVVETTHSVNCTLQQLWLRQQPQNCDPCCHFLIRFF